MIRRRFLQLSLLSGLAGAIVSTANGATFDDTPTQQYNLALSSEELLLENEFLTARLSSVDGALAQITNKLTGETYTTSATTFEIHTDHGTLLSSKLPIIHFSHSGNTIDLTFGHTTVTLDVQYELRPERHFLAKTVSITNTGPEDVANTDIIMDRLRFTPEFREAYSHDDGTDWKCPLNAFLRTKKSGLFAGTENPYFETIVPGALEGGEAPGIALLAALGAALWRNICRRAELFGCL